MTIYIALLRGINVSGKNIIKMDALKMAFSQLGFVNVRTYIQSGNIIFEAKKTKIEAIEKSITAQIEKAFELVVPTQVLETSILAKTIEANPFLNKPEDKLHLTFLNTIPSKENIAKITGNFAEDEFIIINNVIYIYCPNGYGNTKLTNTFLEKKLAVIATTRNWKTCNTLLEMALL